MTRRERGFRLPHAVYPIIDAGGATSGAPVALAEALLDAGVRILQVRAKGASTRDLRDLAGAIQRRGAASAALLVVNDRADVARLVGAGGVHLGQTDLHPRDARSLLGPQAVIGLSTHDADQVRAADDLDDIDYIGFGPVFETASKLRPDPVQGIEGLRRVRALTTLPIVAIGGITPRTAAAVLEAGADAVAMIGAIASADDPVAVVRPLMD
jgi:thiamine-phosphate pyrophosphorylase